MFRFRYRSVLLKHRLREPIDDIGYYDIVISYEHDVADFGMRNLAQ